MTITYIIPGATLLDQLAPTTLDGLPNDNANDNCVPTSIAEGLHILTGGTFDGDELKDAVYGASYTGFQGASAYVDYCAAHGVTLAAHNDTQAGLVATIHTQVSAGHPVIVTMPSMWGTAPADPLNPSGTTHVGIAVGVGPGEIRVMNPWHAFWQDQPDSWWQARLCFGQVWLMQKKVSVTVSGIPTGWTDDGKTLTAPGGAAGVSTGFRTYILTNPWNPQDIPIGPETDVAEVELANPAHGAGTVQYFRYSALIWSRSEDKVYLSWVGREAMTMRAALATADAQAQKDAATIGAQAGQIATLTAQVAQLQAQVKNLQATQQPPTAPAPTTPAAAAALLVSLIYAEADATLKAASSTPAAG